MKNASETNALSGQMVNISNIPLINGTVNYRQGRTYGPLMSLLLASFLSKTLAKIAAATFVPLAYDPWLHQKPINYFSYNNAQYSNAWHPIDPYHQSHDHFHDQNHEIQGAFSEQQTQVLNETNSIYNLNQTKNETEPVASESINNFRYQRVPQRWNPFFKQNRFNAFPDRYTDFYKRRYAAPYYDYNYQDLSPYRNPFKKIRQPPFRRPALDNYDYNYYDNYNDDYYDYDRTTKPYRVRRPTKYRNKNKKNKYRPISSEESSEESSESNSSEDTSRQATARQQTTSTAATTTMTTSSTTTTSGGSTTTAQPLTTTTTIPSTTDNTNNNTTAYGSGYPGVDNISITYGPPSFDNSEFSVYGPPTEDIGYNYGVPNPPGYQYSNPYIQWYPSQEEAKSSLVKKIRDIVSYNQYQN